MDMYKFSINKKYIVSTIRKSFINEMVEVIGIITYEEAKNTGFNVQILALNEKVVTDYTDTNNVVDYPSYFAAVEFYKCKRINSSKSEIIILFISSLFSLPFSLK